MSPSVGAGAAAIALLAGGLLLPGAASAAPTAAFSSSPASPRPGEQVTFTSTSGGGVVDYEWDLNADGRFGGPGEPSGRGATTASRSFDTAGRYSVSLRVTDAAGAKDTATNTVDVSNPPPPPPPPPSEPSRFIDPGPGLEPLSLASPKSITIKLKLSPAIVGNCAAVYEGQGAHFYFVKNPDTPCFTGSTAKAVTIHVALRAVKAGKVSLGDVVAFTADSVDEYCRCLGDYADALGMTASADYAVEGEQIGLDDALYATAMSAVEPTVSLSAYIAQAVLHGNKNPPASNSESLDLRKEFAGLMNDRFAALGLTSSVFSNEHGGNLGLGDLPVPKSSSRDMVRFWNNAIGDHPWFLTALGLRSQKIKTNIEPGILKDYAFGKWYGYYPRAQGDKNGGVTPPGGITYSSLLGSVSRLGRVLSFNVMENADDGDSSTYNDAFADSGKILQYSYSLIFDPDRRGDSGGQSGGIGHQALDCWGKTRCVNAVRTASGRLKLITWKPDVGAKDVDKLDELMLDDPVVAAVDVAHLGAKAVFVPPSSNKASAAAPKNYKPGNDLVISIERRGGTDLLLRSWKIGPNGDLTQLGSHGAGQGFDVPRVQRLGERTFVTANRTPGGKLSLVSWRVSNSGDIDLGAGKLTNGKILAPVAVTDSARPHGVVTDVRLESGREKLILWQVDEDTGAITRLSDTGDAGSVVGKVSVARVGAFQYASAGVMGGKAQVNMWTVSPDGKTWKKQGDMTAIPASGVSETALAPLGSGAAVLAVRAGSAGNLKLFPMEFDPAYDSYNFHIEDYHVLGGATNPGAAELIDIARVKSDAAAGDYVIAIRAPAGNLKLINWRVGKKP